MALFRIMKLIKPLKKRIAIISSDIKRKLEFGRHAPKHLETIWVNPQNIHSFIPKEEIFRVTGMSRKKASGCVVEWSNVSKFIPLEHDFRYRYAFERWRDGKSWEEIGVYEYMKNETKKYRDMSQTELEERYRTFDLLFEEVKKDGRLKRRSDVDPTAFREENGILIHIGEGGNLYFGGVGFHRFSISKVLNLQKIPACVGIVAKDAIEYLQELRTP